MAGADSKRRDHGWRIGVDVGGTFTDLVLVAPEGRLRVFKVPSVPADPAQGVLDALAAAAAGVDLTVKDLLVNCAVFVHGSTVATNTVLERKGAKVGLLTSEGFRDSLEIRRGQRADPWDHRKPYPPVLVPRHLRLPVAGRTGKDGRQRSPLGRGDVERAAASFRDEGVEAVAICLFNAFLDPAQEREAAAVLAEKWGGDWVTLSSRLAPVMGEYERSSTAVMNAYVAPRTVSYLRALDRELSRLGLAQPLLMIQNNGGAVSVRQIAERPATLLLSGPAAGVGSLRYYGAALGSDDLISMEIGGTSCDVILMSKGEAPLTDALVLEEMHLALPSVDVHTIGAGGGTIAGVDAAGLLFVGPEGAGARPGPACYGHGGTEPTVTDAQVVLGRLKQGPYAGGSVTVDASLARGAIESRLAGPLGLSVEEAAIGVIRLMEQKLLHAVQRISIERGHDPRAFTLVACGGAGPMHGAPIARALGSRQLYVPRLAGAFCALGMLHSDVRHDHVQVHLAELEGADEKRISAILDALSAQALQTLESEGFTANRTRLQALYDLRYRGQQWDLTVPAASLTFDAADLRRRFEADHDRCFGHIQPDGIIEITKVRLAGIGLMPLLAVNREAPVDEEPSPSERRPVWLGSESGWAEVPVYQGGLLKAGHAFVGPALIDEQTTTVLVGPGDRLEVDPSGNYKVAIHA